MSPEALRRRKFGENWQTEGLSIYRKDRLDVRYDRYVVAEACRSRLVEVWACMCDPRGHSAQRAPRGPVTLTALRVAMKLFWAEFR